MVLANVAAEFLPPSNRHKWNETEGEECPALDWNYGGVVASRTNHLHVSVALQRTREILGTTDEEEKHGDGCTLVLRFDDACYCWIECVFARCDRACSR